MLLLSVHLLATAAMVGLIWFVQVVHYPLFAAVGAAEFVAYEQAHQRRTAYVVGPPMAVEGVTALVLLVAAPDGVGPLLPWLGAALLAVIHASTVFLQVPAHAALAQSPDRRTIDRLVRTNWIRTIGWTARGAVAVAMLVAAAS
jgi:hypothetical protein